MVVVALLSFGAVAFAGGDVACVLQIPRGTCHPELVDAIDPALTVTPSAGPTAAQCETCLEDHCCDAVGHCDDEPNCESAVRSAHQCVLQGGATRETACVNEIGTARGLDAYRCMRDQCGDACGLPVCHVDPAVGLILSPTCDACFANSCCAELNACAGNRACQLMTECILNRCGPAFGPTLAATPLDQLDQRISAVCSGAPGPPGIDGSGVSLTCVDECFQDFANQKYVQGPFGDVTQQSGCLAFKVYACGARAQCGPACTLEAGGSDASADAPGDAPRD